MNELTRVVLRSGLIPDTMLAEFKKWGFTPPSDVASMPAPKTHEMLIQQLDHALQAEDLVMMRETDLVAITTYLKTMKTGTLHLVLDDEMVQGESSVSYGVLPSGEYMLPWIAEAIDDMLINGHTFLQTAEGENVFFSNVRELFFGEQKAFVVCKVSTREDPNGHQQTVDAPQE